MSARGWMRAGGVRARRLHEELLGLAAVARALLQHGELQQALRRGGERQYAPAAWVACGSVNWFREWTGRCTSPHLARAVASRGFTSTAWRACRPG